MPPTCYLFSIDFHAPSTSIPFTSHYNPSLHFLFQFHPTPDPLPLLFPTASLPSYIMPSHFPPLSFCTSFLPLPSIITSTNCRRRRSARNNECAFCKLLSFSLAV